MDKILQAKWYGRGCHDGVGQKRKYTNTPYWFHTEDVADMVQCVGSDDMVCAALLHDVLEDTYTTYEEILKLFGKRVADLVQELTDQYTDTCHGNRQRRKTLEADRLSKVSPEAQTIKCADLISNSKDIVEYDKEFAKTYLKEKKMYLDVMKDADPILRERAYMTLSLGDTLKLSVAQDERAEKE